jgi:ketosteroid isomerase-like protein
MQTADIVAIQQIYALYGYVMDDRAWDRLGDVFTTDCVFDATEFGLPIAEGLDGVRAMSEAAQEPLAHHVTNVLVESIDGDHATARAKALGTYPKGRAFSGQYDDTLVRTGDGWRIRQRVTRPQTPLPQAAAD